MSASERSNYVLFVLLTYLFYSLFQSARFKPFAHEIYS